MYHCAVPREKLFSTFPEWKHVPAERSSQENGSRRDQSSAVCFENHGSVASFSQYRILEQLLSESPFSCKTAQKNEKSDWGGCSAVEKDWSALSKSNGQENLQTANWLNFMYDCRTVLLHVPISRSDGFSSRPQTEFFDVAERPVTTKKK